MTPLFSRCSTSRVLRGILLAALLGCGGGGGDDDGPVAVGLACGGLQGLTCPSGQFCNFTDAGCGAADQLGVCETPPEVCTEIFAPVCGCDGKTYSNECFALGAGVSVSASGEC